MRITLEWLRKQGACREGMEAVRERFPDGAEVAELAEWLQATNISWLDWLRDHLSIAEVVGWWARSASISALVADRLTAAKKTKEASDDSGAASATGERGAASATGWNGAASAAGWCGAASATGVNGAASATGESGAASATGMRGAASATGWRGAASATGVRGAASATGMRGAASATGWRGAASATGERGAASATGLSGAAESGPCGAAVVTGADGCARAGEGGCIALAFERDDKFAMRCAEVSAKRKGCLKPDTWYRLDSRGRFVMVKE